MFFLFFPEALQKLLHWLSLPLHCVFQKEKAISPVVRQPVSNVPPCLKKDPSPSDSPCVRRGAHNTAKQNPGRCCQPVIALEVEKAENLTEEALKPIKGSVLPLLVLA